MAAYSGVKEKRLFYNHEKMLQDKCRMDEQFRLNVGMGSGKGHLVSRNVSICK